MTVAIDVRHCVNPHTLVWCTFNTMSTLIFNLCPNRFKLKTTYGWSMFSNNAIGSVAYACICHLVLNCYSEQFPFGSGCDVKHVTIVHSVHVTVIRCPQHHLSRFTWDFAMGGNYFIDDILLWNNTEEWPHLHSKEDR